MKGKTMCGDVSPEYSRPHSVLETPPRYLGIEQAVQLAYSNTSDDPTTAIISTYCHIYCTAIATAALCNTKPPCITSRATTKTPRINSSHQHNPLSPKVLASIVTYTCDPVSTSPSTYRSQQHGSSGRPLGQQGLG